MQKYLEISFYFEVLLKVFFCIVRCILFVVYVGNMGIVIMLKYDC